MYSGKQFTPCRVFGCAWKIWSNGKSFPSTVKYPPHKCKSFYTFILPSNHFHPQKISLLTHSHHSRQAQAEGRRELSPMKPRSNPRPCRSNRIAQTHRRFDHAASASPSCSNPSPMNVAKPTPISPHPSP